MKTKLLYLLAILFLLTGCSTDNDPEPENTHLLNRKTSEISFTDGSMMTIEWHYTYNVDGKLSAIHFTSDRAGIINEGTTELAYNEKGWLNHIINGLGESWMFYYGDNGQLVRLDKISVDGSLFVYLYTYSEKGKLIESKTYKGNATEEGYVGNMRLDYDQSNEIKLTRSLASGEIYNEATIVTDDHKRPLPALPIQISISFHSSEIFNESYFTENNVIDFRDVQIRETNVVEKSFRCNYTYNEAGYPVTSIKTFDTGSIEKSTYTYSVK